MNTGSTRAPARWWWPALAVGSSVLVISLGSVTWFRLGHVALTGRQITGDLVPLLGYAALALAVLSLTVRGRGRRLVAVGLAVLGLAELATAWTQRLPDPTQLAALGASGSGSPTGAWWGLLIGGFLTMVAAVGLGVTASAAPNHSARFERRASAPADPHLAAWRAMDAGLDPTADPPAGSPSEAERGNLSRSTPTSFDAGLHHDGRAHSGPINTHRKGRDA